MQGAAYTVLVARTDVDGNMTDGVRHPTLAAPIGTHTGWNLRRKGFAEDQQCAGTGSFIPFASTQTERQGTGDPRRSLDERYPTHAAYVKAVSDAADVLVADRLLLQIDADAIVKQASSSRTKTEN
tara:strand:- start:153 stop:530 length:378 start_codon:yes stop_codon:yes gene_type:complete